MEGHFQADEISLSNDLLRAAVVIRQETRTDSRPEVGNTSQRAD